MSFEILINETRQISLDLPQAESVRVGEEIFFEDTGICREGQVPYALIYENEGAERACRKLHKVMLTPDSIPRSRDPQSDEIKRKLQGALDRNFSQRDSDRRTAAAAMITVIKEESFNPTRFRYYEDTARVSPFYTESWREPLIWQFGLEEYVRGCVGANREFWELLIRSRELGDEYNPLRRVPIDVKQVAQALERQFSVIEEHGSDTVRLWNNMREERKFGQYKRKAYELRGLTYIAVAR